MKKISALILFVLFCTWAYLFLSLKFERHEYHPVSVEQRQAATDYLIGKLTPAPKEWQWQSFSVNPGVKLRTGIIRAENSKGTIIVVPGFTAPIEMLLREITHFHRAGYTVAAIEYRGQGRSYRPLDNPEKGYVESYSLIANEVAQFADSVKESGKPLFFYSISKGAHITLRAAMENELDVAAYALMVPMIKINTGSFNYTAVKYLAKLLNAIGLGEIYAPGQHRYQPGKLGEAIPCNANPDTAQLQDALFALNEELRVRGSTAKWLLETMASTQFITDDKNQDKMTQPVLLFTVGKDELVDSQVAQAFCSHLQQCDNRHIEQSRHCIAEEDYQLYDSLLDEAVMFFNNHR